MGKKKRLVEHFYTKGEIKAVNEGIFDEEPKKISPEIRERALGAIKEYNKYSKMIHREGNLLDIAKTLAEIAEFASRYTVEEAGDWFDGVTVKRNMNDLKKLSVEFAKVAKEVQGHQDRMGALYEDMGGILNRYFEIHDLTEEPEPETRRTDNYLRQGDRAKVNMNVVRSENPTPRHIRGVQEEISRGKGTVKIQEFKGDFAVVSGGDISLSEVEIPKKALTKVVGRMSEAAKFDKSKMEKLVKKDKFLGAQYKTGTSLEVLFNTYVLGDSVQEREYNKVK
jgi:hypothetical protein